MEPTYTAQKIEETAHGWIVINDETGEKTIVFCSASANTAEDAIATFVSSMLNEEPQ